MKRGPGREAVDLVPATYTARGRLRDTLGEVTPRRTRESAGQPHVAVSLRSRPGGLTSSRRYLIATGPGDKSRITVYASRMFLR